MPVVYFNPNYLWHISPLNKDALNFISKNNIWYFFPVMDKQVIWVDIIKLLVKGAYIHKLKTRPQYKEMREIVIKLVLNTEIKQLTLKKPYVVYDLSFGRTIDFHLNIDIFPGWYANASHFDTVGT